MKSLRRLRRYLTELMGKFEVSTQGKYSKNSFKISWSETNTDEKYI
jgi:hypothetical protein